MSIVKTERQTFRIRIVKDPLTHTHSRTDSLSAPDRVVDVSAYLERVAQRFFSLLKKGLLEDFLGSHVFLILAVGGTEQVRGNIRYAT